MNKTNMKASTIRNINDLPLVLTVSDISEILVIGKNTAYELVRSGRIKSVQVGRQIRIPKSALLEYLS
ncbi:helix-turn-helix domain-containing protein [uncultured Oscillibacter sp.]|uniref:helix-turn-helix domain-containing protein n=1 Tax=uncultured Oscillibacter sp. TaxID=876091 RepID=UPI0025FF3C55|nr:helix-turn-helix domain-containing protein [uncultured Oscillibacter sp.]